MDNQHKSGSAGTKPRSGTQRKAAPASGQRKKTASAGQRRPAAAQPARQPQRKQQQTRRPARKKTVQRPRVTPEVVYTPAKPFSRNRFLLRLLTVAAVVIAIVFGISIFFKVETVVVSGTNKYTAWDVKEASGIKEGDNLLTLNEAKVYGKIKVKLPYVDTVRISIKLPDTVNIIIEEFEVCYAIKAEDGTTWLVTSDGKVVEQVSASAATNYTNILGVTLASPKAGSQAVAAENASGDGEQTEALGADDRLKTALTILQYLEANGIIGEAASVDVSDMGNIQMWYGTQYKVLLGDTSKLSKKIYEVALAIGQMDAYQSGELDASYTIWPDHVGYSPSKS